MCKLESKTCMDSGVIMIYCRIRKENITQPEIRAYCEIVDEYTTCNDCVFCNFEKDA